MVMRPIVDANASWYCPIIRAEITYVRCLEINYEHHLVMNVGAVAAIAAEAKTSAAAVKLMCATCPNNPVDEREP